MFRPGRAAARIRRPFVVLACALLAAATMAGVAELAGASTSGPTAAAGAPQPMVRAPALAAGPLPAGATYMGAAPALSPVDLDVVLAPSNEAQLAQFDTEVSTPGSAVYHDYLTEQQFAAEFAPPAPVAAEAEAWLAAAGLTVSQTSPFVVSATGSAAALSAALGVQFGQYDAAGGTAGIVASGDPLVPADLASGQLAGLLGLDTLAPPQDFVSRPAATATAAGPSPAPQARPTTPEEDAGSPSACTAASSMARASDSYSVDQLASYYGLTGLERAGQDGAGVSIALVEINASSAPDVTSYETCFGLSNAVSVVDVDGGPPAGSLDEGEADIDIEMSATLAPDASITAYESPPTDMGIFDSMQAIVDSGSAKVISMSLGQCEGGSAQFEDSVHQLIMQATALGQTVVASSGDTGSEGCFDGSADSTAHTLSVSYPASDPLVTAAGGSVLSGAGELAWDDCNGAGSLNCAEDLGVGASGGGVSSIYGSVTGQPQLAGTGGYREVPDVSAESGSNFGDDVVFYNDGSWGPWLGTSLAAPLWAALVADRDSTCVTPTGDFNGALYSFYNTSYYADAFNPVVEGYTYNASTLVPETGTNDFTQANNGAYPIGPGYNMVTGLGTPIAGGLACSQVTGSYAGQAGQDVTLDGLGLENASIYFRTAPAEILVATATHVTVQVPSGSGQVPVYAEGTLGQSSVTGEFTYETNATTTTTVPTTTTTAATTTTTAATTTTTAATTTTTAATTTTTAATTTTTAATTTTTAATTTTTAATTTTTRSTTTTTSSGSSGSLTGGGPSAPPPMTTTTTAGPTTTTIGATTVTTTVPPTTATTQVKSSGTAVRPTGFWMVSSDGGVFDFGNAGYHGSLPARNVHVKDIVAMAPVPGGGGYWMVGKDGRVYYFGTAGHFGGLSGRAAQADDIVAIAPAPSGSGYWLVSASGKVFPFGHAGNYGSVKLTGHQKADIVSIAPTPDGRGYWVAAATGTVWHFGDAADLGSLGAGHGSTADIVAIAPTPDGRGYWLVAKDGAVSNFGDAAHYRPRTSAGLAGTVGIAPTSDGDGYWVVSASGAVVQYGDAGPVGSLPAYRVTTKSVVGVASV